MDDEDHQNGEVLNVCARLPEERKQAQPDDVHEPVAGRGRSYPCVDIDGGFIRGKEPPLKKSIFGMKSHEGEPPYGNNRLRIGGVECEGNGCRDGWEEYRQRAVGAHDRAVKLEPDGDPAILGDGFRRPPEIRCLLLKMFRSLIFLDARAGHLCGVSSPRLEPTCLPGLNEGGKVSLNGRISGKRHEKSPIPAGNEASFE
ncbi:MAG: hypothetical protein Q7U42_02290, partial [Parvibaculum sp.]|nr:hypothetical protein [Parvibaculum sp.]